VSKQQWVIKHCNQCVHFEPHGDHSHCTHEHRFTVPGRPVPKQRARVYHDRKLGKIRGVTPDATRQYENNVGLFALARRPRGWPKGIRYAVHIDAHVALTQRDKRPRKIDLDNVVKSVLDGLNKILWDDDHQVDALSARRWPAATGQERTEVRVTAIAGLVDAVLPKSARESLEG